MPDAWTMPVAAAMLRVERIRLQSERTRRRPITSSQDSRRYWNVVVFYLLVVGWPSWVNAVVLLVFVLLVFVPVRYVYPSRTPILQRSTNVIGSIWSVLMLLMLWQYPAVSRPVMWVSLVFPAYYFALSLWLWRAPRPDRDDACSAFTPSIPGR